MLKRQKTMILWIVLHELYNITLQEENVMEADRRDTLIIGLNLNIVWDTDESTMLPAAKPET